MFFECSRAQWRLKILQLLALMKITMVEFNPWTFFLQTFSKVLRHSNKANVWLWVVAGENVQFQSGELQWARQSFQRLYPESWNCHSINCSYFCSRKEPFSFFFRCFPSQQLSVIPQKAINTSPRDQLHNVNCKSYMPISVRTSTFCYQCSRRLHRKSNINLTSTFGRPASLPSKVCHDTVLLQMENKPSQMSTCQQNVLQSCKTWRTWNESFPHLNTQGKRETRSNAARSPAMDEPRPPRRGRSPKRTHPVMSYEGSAVLKV